MLIFGNWLDCLLEGLKLLAEERKRRDRVLTYTLWWHYYIKRYNKRYDRYVNLAYTWTMDPDIETIAISTLLSVHGSSSLLIVNQDCGREVNSCWPSKHIGLQRA